MSEHIKLEPLHRNNWENYAQLAVPPESSSYLQSNLFVIARSTFEGLKLFGILNGTLPVGLMATYQKDALLWISHIMVDRMYQQRGYGSKALTLLQIDPSIARFSEIRTGVIKENIPGLRFFMENGFVPMHEMPDGEIILQKVK